MTSTCIATETTSIAPMRARWTTTNEAGPELSPDGLLADLLAALDEAVELLAEVSPEELGAGARVWVTALSQQARRAAVALGAAADPAAPADSPPVVGVRDLVDAVRRLRRVVEAGATASAPLDVAISRSWVEGLRAALPAV